MKNKTENPLLPPYETRDMLIPWSGGCDSTLLVVEAIRAHHRVRTISFSTDQIAGSSRQQVARKILRLKLQGRFGCWVHDEIDIETSETAHFHRGPLGNAQAVYWTMLSAMYARASDLVSIAWIENDGVWSTITDIETVFETSVKILDIAASLYLPFRYHNKVEILQRLKALRISTRDMWWCQQSKIKKQSARCVCSSCTIYRQALTEMRFLEKRKRR